MNTQGHRNPNSAREKDLHFHTMSFFLAGSRFLPGAKFAYVLLNTPTACPPRTAVPVNRPATTRIAGGSPARPATLTSNARLIGFALTGGSLSGTNNGAGAFVDAGCLISDCVISNNQTALCFDAATPGGKGGGLYLLPTKLTS